MPKLDDIIQNREKKHFVKRKYRAWDLTGNNNEQIGHKQLGNNQVTIREQLGNNQVTIREQLGNTLGNNQVTIREQLGNTLGNKIDTKNYFEKIKKLSGIQEKIFFYALEICCFNGSLETGNIYTNELIEHTKHKYGSIKTSINRLLIKGLIIRHKGKSAKGGYINLAITKEIKIAGTEIKCQKNIMPKNDPCILEIREQLGNTLGNNSPYYNNNNIIIRDNLELPHEWAIIDTEPLTEIGFTDTHIKQIYRSGKSSPEIVQESIHHFAFAIEYKKEVIEKKYKGLINAIMSVLRKGSSWFEETYKSPQQIALAGYFEQKKKEKEEMDKILDNLLNLEFPEWKSGLSKEKIAEIVPSDLLEINLMPAIESALRSYFLKNILKPRIEREGILIFK